MEGEDEENDGKTKSCVNNDSDESSCPGCGAPALPFSQRLIEDNCGHKKCRKCLLVEESGCSQCEVENNQNEDIENPKVQHSSAQESPAFNSLKDSTSPSHDGNRTSEVTQTLSVSNAVSSQLQPVVSSNNCWALSADVSTILSKSSAATTSSFLTSLLNVAASTSSTPAVSTTMVAPIEYLVSKDCTGFPPPLEAKVIAVNNDSEIPEYKSSNNSKSLFSETENQINCTLPDKDNISLRSIHPDGIPEPNQLQGLNDQNRKKQCSSQFAVKQGDKTTDKSDDIHIQSPSIKPAASDSNFQRRSVIVVNKKRVQNKLPDKSDSTLTNEQAPQTSIPSRSLDFESSLEETLRKELIEKARDATSAAFYTAAQQYTNNYYSEIEDPTDHLNQSKNIAVKYTSKIEKNEGNQSENSRNISSPSDEHLLENVVEHRYNDEIPIQSNMEQNLINELSVHFQDFREDHLQFPFSLPKRFDLPTVDEQEDEIEPHAYLFHNKIADHNIKVQQKQSKISPDEDLRLYQQQKTLSQWLRKNLQKDLSEEDALNQHQELPRYSPVLNQDPQGHQDQQLLEIQEEGQGSQDECDIRFQNNVALEQAEIESTRSYNYEDRGLGLNKLEMLTNWLSKCQQKNANSDDQDSLRGEVEIGDERQIILTEDDLIMSKIEDAPSITLQDPEEVIQRGQEVSNTFLQEIQNAMEIVSTTSSQGEGERDNLLPEHIAIQDEDNGILLCRRCHKSFVFDDCKKHIKCKEKKSASVSKQYECTFCDKKCQSSSHLKYHIRSAHTGERPYKCTLCSMSFLQIVKLKRHILTHTGEKPYQCDICHVSFRTGYHLKEHRNIHTKLTHHSCDICSRSFADSSNLRRHMKNLHGKKLAACKFCSQNLPTKHDLMIHKAKEHSSGIKQQHICDYCNKNFATTTSLNKHIISSHMKQKSPERISKVNNNESISKENLHDKKTSQGQTSALVKTLQCSTSSHIVPIVDNNKTCNFNSKPLLIEKSSDQEIEKNLNDHKSNMLDGPKLYQGPSQSFGDKPRYNAFDGQASISDMKVVNEVSSSLLKAIKTSPSFKKSSQVAKIKNPGAITNLFEQVSNIQSSQIVASKKSQAIDPNVSSLSALPLSSFTNGLSTSSYNLPVSALDPALETSSVTLVSASTPLMSHSVAKVTLPTNTNPISTSPTSIVLSSGQRLPIVSEAEQAYHLKEINQHELNSVQYVNAMIKNQQPKVGYLRRPISPSGLVDFMPSVTQQNDEIHHSLPPLAPIYPVRGSISQHVHLLVKEKLGSEPGSSTRPPQSKVSHGQGHLMVPSVHSLPTLTLCESPAVGTTHKDDPKLKSSTTENPVNNNPSSNDEENDLFPSQPWDSLTNLNLQEKAILKILFEENRLDVPAEFLDTVDISDTINPTKKRFLSRYRNQSGIAARVPKESCDPETLHSLIETSKVLLSSNSIHISLTKEQEQNFILSMLKIIKETNS